MRGPGVASLYVLAACHAQCSFSHAACALGSLMGTRLRVVSTDVASALQSSHLTEHSGDPAVGALSLYSWPRSLYLAT